MFDRRNLTSDGVGAPIYKFEGHKAAVLSVQVILVVHVLLFSMSENFSFLGSTSVYNQFCLYFQWSPDKSSVFGSSAEDGLLNIWDYEKVWPSECTVVFNLVILNHVLTEWISAPLSFAFSICLLLQSDGSCESCNFMQT